MGRRPRHKIFIEKSKEAVQAAIGLYNHPKNVYREEGFSMLMLNGWELLLKAQVLKHNNEDLKSIYIEDKRAKKKNGSPYAKPKYKRNGSGNYLTKEVAMLVNQENMLDEALKEQLKTLIEIRNNSSHLVLSPELKKVTLTVFTASLKSYMEHLRVEFGEKIEDNLYLIPIALNIPDHFSGKIDHSEETALFNYIQNAQKSVSKESKHQICLDIDIKFNRSKEGIKVVKSTEGVSISIDSEEAFKNAYPWTYQGDLLPKLKKYSNFKMSRKFHDIMKELESNEEFSRIRYLDWNKKTGQKKRFYNSKIVQELEKQLGLIDDPAQ
jgi:hypothetical protein